MKKEELLDLASKVCPKASFKLIEKDRIYFTCDCDDCAIYDPKYGCIIRDHAKIVLAFLRKLINQLKE